MRSWHIHSAHLLPYISVYKPAQKYIQNVFTLPGLSVIQSHPMCRICFGQYQATSAALGWLGDGDCYLMHTLMYIYRTHLLPFHHHCVPTKCAGFTRNQENSGSHSTGTTPSRLRTHIVSCRRKEAVQMSMKCR